MVGQWFAGLYDLAMEPLERRMLGMIRENLIDQAKGTVLEIGSGTGANFPFYNQADRVIAIEPDPYMREKSCERAKLSRVPIEVLSYGAEQLPFLDHSFDTVVGTLVFCTIPQPAHALAEIRRICKPNGQLLLLEHVRLKQKLPALLQDWLTPVWKRLCGGCHLNRNTLELVQQAGFRVVRVEQHLQGLFVVLELLNEE